MRILYVTASFPFGASEMFLDAELAELRARGHEVFVLPTLPRGPNRLVGEPEMFSLIGSSLRDWRSWFRACSFALSHPRLVAAHLRLCGSGTPRLALRNLACLPVVLSAAATVARQKFDHIHAYWGSVPATLAMLLAGTVGVPWSMTLHRWDIYDNNMLALKGKSCSFARFISKRGMRTGIALGVPANKAHLLRLGVQMPASVASERRVSPESSRGGEFRVLCPAALVPIKGHAYLIEAVCQLRSEGMAVELDLAGQGPLEPSLRELVESRGASSFIHFLGFVPHRDLLAGLDAGRWAVVTLCSRELPGGEHEGVPVSLMEAMSRGLPVVATATGSIGELVPADSGLLIEPDSSESIAKAIRRLHDAPAFYRIRANECRAIIERGWAIEATTAALESHFLAERAPLREPIIRLETMGTE